MPNVVKQGYIKDIDLSEEYWSTDNYFVYPKCKHCGQTLSERDRKDPDTGLYSSNWYQWSCVSDQCQAEYEKHLMQLIEKRKMETKDAPELTHEQCLKYNVGSKYKAVQLSHFTDEISNFCRDFIQNDSPGLLLYGDTGTGKTYLTIAILRQFIRSGYKRIYFDNVPKMLNRIHDTMSDDSSISYSKMIDRYSQYYDVLGIDDYGAQKQTEASDAEIFSIINTRYNNGAKTILTTNFKPEYIHNNVDKRLGSRLMEYDSLLLDGQDKRKKYGGRVLHVRD